MWAKDRRLELDLELLVLFLFEFVSLSSVQCSQDVWQYAVLYTGDGGSGEPLMIMEEDTENLEELGFANAKSECHIGAWVRMPEKFSETWSNADRLGASGCHNGNAKGKALRFVGDPSNYTRDALTLFEDLAYAKSKEVIYTDGNVKMGLINSLAATGSADWTIYKDPNFAGDSYCLKFTYEDYSHFLIQLYGPKFPKGFNIEKEWISSVRKGCHSSSIVTPER